MWVEDRQKLTMSPIYKVPNHKLWATFPGFFYNQKEKLPTGTSNFQFPPSRPDMILVSTESTPQSRLLISYHEACIDRNGHLPFATTTTT
jgi:hypothetical protein